MKKGDIVIYSPPESVAEYYQKFIGERCTIEKVGGSIVYISYKDDMWTTFIKNVKLAENFHPLTNIFK